MSSWKIVGEEIRAITSPRTVLPTLGRQDGSGQGVYSPTSSAVCSRTKLGLRCIKYDRIRRGQTTHLVMKPHCETLAGKVVRSKEIHPPLPKPKANEGCDAFMECCDVPVYPTVKNTTAQMKVTKAQAKIAKAQAKRIGNQSKEPKVQLKR